MAARLKITKDNRRDFIRRGPKILQLYGRALNTQLREEIKTEQFDWPNRTVRRSGEIVEAGPRNIVDLGNFLRSQRRKTVNVNLITFTWGGSESGVNYAGFIFQGANGRPGRDWTAPALEALPLDRFFAREWRKLASAGL